MAPLFHPEPGLRGATLDDIGLGMLFLKLFPDEGADLKVYGASAILAYPATGPAL